MPKVSKSFESKLKQSENNNCDSVDNSETLRETPFELRNEFNDNGGTSLAKTDIDHDLTLSVKQTAYGKQNQIKDEIKANVGNVGNVAEQQKQRGQWSKGIEFLLSCISMSVGLGNVWRFPYAAYKNGGGAFLIPYLLLLFIIGRPMYYMELILGQFSGRGPIKVWKCVPALKGIGFAQILSTAYLTIFYNYLMALTLYYLFSSFANPLPWSVCNPDWVPTGCSNNINQTTTPIPTNMSYFENSDVRITGQNDHNITWSEYYWLNHVLKKSTGLDDINLINWKLTLCLVGSWLVVYLSIVKGVSSLGKVAYFTAIFPYTVLIALLIVALNVDGATEGIIFFFKPKWRELLNPIVWYNAVEQSFFSLGVCFGALIMYSSYNGFRNNVYRDAIIISVLDTFTSILAGCVIFSILGTMAKDSNKNIEEIVEGGLGLAFVVYPEALSKIKFVPQLWSVLFFIMLFTLGVGSSVAQIETILTSIKDEFTSLHKRKGLLALGICSLFCVLGIPLTTDAGSYMMGLLDNYGVGTAVFFYGISQTIGIMWIYGFRRFCDDAHFMLNQTVGIFWRYTWVFTAPIALIVIFLYGNIQLVINNEPVDGIPSWGIGIGWALAALAVFQIPLWIIVTVMGNRGSLQQRIRKAFTSAPDWGPINREDYEQWIKRDGNALQMVSVNSYYDNKAFATS